MLKKITLAVLLGLGAVTLTGVSAPDARADDNRATGVFKLGDSVQATFRFHQGRRNVRPNRHGTNRRFLKRVRRGAIVCFKKPSRRHGQRAPQRGHRYDRPKFRRLGYRAVKRAVRQGRRHALRCFRRA